MLLIVYILQDRDSTAYFAGLIAKRGSADADPGFAPIVAGVDEIYARTYDFSAQCPGARIVRKWEWEALGTETSPTCDRRRIATL